MSERNDKVKLARIKEIEARLEEMDETLSGCDWCCGGGDEERDELEREKDAIKWSFIKR